MSSTTTSTTLIDMPFEILDKIFKFAMPDTITVCSAESTVQLYVYINEDEDPMRPRRSMHKIKPPILHNPVLPLLLVSKQWYCQVPNHDLPIPTLRFCSRVCAVKTQNRHRNLECFWPGSNFKIVTTVRSNGIEEVQYDLHGKLYTGSARGDLSFRQSRDICIGHRTMTLTPVRESETYGYEPPKKFMPESGWNGIAKMWKFFRLQQTATFDGLDDSTQGPLIPQFSATHALGYDEHLESS